MMVLPALAFGGYQCMAQVNIGRRFGGGRHIIDVIATDNHGQETLVSLKWQQVSGTAEQKVPFEAMCLAEAILTSEGRYQRAYVVLGGNGWRLRDFFVGGGLNRHLAHGDLVRIVTLDTFVGLANRGLL